MTRANLWLLIGLASLPGGRSDAASAPPRASTPAKPADAAAQSKGHIVHNGATMEVRYAVAVWTPKETELRFYLLPAKPSAAKVELFQQGKHDNQGSWAEFGINWRFKPEAMPDPKERWLHIAVMFVDPKERVLSATLAPPGFTGTLTGNIKPGEQVTLVTKGEDAPGNQKVTWDLNVTAKILPAIE